MSGKLHFPVLKQLQISGYELYPGERSNVAGINHLVKPGVNIIVGTNGIGKTTLLNVVQRLLLGPWDPAKADRLRPGRKQAQMNRVRNFTYFRERATDLAVDAWAEGTFTFGTSKITIRRSLYDLRLLSYSINDDSSTTSEEESLIGRLCNMLGVSSEFGYSIRAHYDFDFVIRHLVFFLEDKVPLIWNPEGQFAILRILLLRSELSAEIAKARNELLRADSLYRNLLWHRNDIADKLEPLLERSAVDPKLLQQRDVLRDRLKVLMEDREDLRSACDHLVDNIRRTEGDAVKLRAKIYEMQDRQREAEAGYFHAAFATHLRNPGDIILDALTSPDGCLVCGATDQEVINEARALMHANCCPVCRSTLTGRAESAGTYEARLRAVREREAETDNAVRQLQSVERQLKSWRDEYDELLKTAEGAQRELLTVRQQLLTLDEELPDDQQVSILKAQLEVLDEELKAKNDEVDRWTKIHASMVQEAGYELEVWEEALTLSFNKYARSFLGEDCFISLENLYMRVGQGDEKIETPVFTVSLRSSPDQDLQRRQTDRSVSESQKEFIDLAFRMALLKVASAGSSSMLVVETPEASLDAVFISRAGHLLREYVSERTDNVLLVSTNLNRENMIGALLDIEDEKRALLVPRKERWDRLINLIAVARETTALADNRRIYVDALNTAIAGAGYPQ